MSYNILNTLVVQCVKALTCKIQIKFVSYKLEPSHIVQLEYHFISAWLYYNQAEMKWWADKRHTT